MCTQGPPRLTAATPNTLAARSPVEREKKQTTTPLNIELNAEHGHGPSDVSLCVSTHVKLFGHSNGRSLLTQYSNKMTAQVVILARLMVNYMPLSRCRTKEVITD